MVYTIPASTKSFRGKFNHVGQIESLIRSGVFVALFGKNAPTRKTTPDASSCVPVTVISTQAWGDAIDADYESR
jgi:hypothetical protein